MNTPEIPPPPPRPRFPPPSVNDFQTPNVRTWFYAGPIIVDCTAMLCTTILCALGKLPIENFKYLIGVLVVGNVALRMPGIGNRMPPGGGGFIIAFISSLILNSRKFWFRL